MQKNRDYVTLFAQDLKEARQLRLTFNGLFKKHDMRFYKKLPNEGRRLIGTATLDGRSKRHLPVRVPSREEM